MIDVALIGISRRWHIRNQISLREISRRLSISRNTVRRHIRSALPEPVYANRKSFSALNKHASKLYTWLRRESAKSRKQKRRLKQMHVDLCELEYDGSYDRVAVFARRLKLNRLERGNLASKGTEKTLFEYPLTSLCIHSSYFLDNILLDLLTELYGQKGKTTFEYQIGLDALSEMGGVNFVQRLLWSEQRDDAILCLLLAETLPSLEKLVEEYPLVFMAQTNLLVSKIKARC